MKDPQKLHEPWTGRSKKYLAPKNPAKISVKIRSFVCLFVCWDKPEILYFSPCVWREVITPGNGCTRNQAQTTCVTLRQRHKPRTCQSMANTLQVDRLARITGRTQARYKTHPQPPTWPPPTPYYSVVGGDYWNFVYLNLLLRFVKSVFLSSKKKFNFVCVCVCVCVCVFLPLSPHTCTMCPMFSLDPSVVGLVQIGRASCRERV